MKLIFGRCWLGTSTCCLDGLVDHYTLTGWHNLNFSRHYHMEAWGKDRARPHPLAERAVIFNACTLYSVLHISKDDDDFGEHMLGLDHAHLSLRENSLSIPVPQRRRDGRRPSTLLYHCAVPRPTPGAGKRRAADQQPRFEISHRDGSPRNRSARWGKDFVPARFPSPHVTVTCHVELSMKA